MHSTLLKCMFREYLFVFEIRKFSEYKRSLYTSVNRIILASTRGDEASSAS